MTPGRGETSAQEVEPVNDWNDHMSGTDWLWMSLSMAVALVLLGVVVYVAVRLANRDR